MRGLIESMQTEFTRALRPMKGASGVAEILRASNNYASSTPAETVYVHYEQRRSDGGGGLDIDVAGQPGYIVHIEGFVSPALVAGDALEIGDLQLSIEHAPAAGNLSPGDVLECVRR